MTKKHFEWAAERVRWLREAGRPEDDVAATQEAYVDLFEHFNPRFDSGRFYAACGPLEVRTGQSVRQRRAARRERAMGEDAPGQEGA